MISFLTFDFSGQDQVRGEAPGVRTEALDLVRREPSLSQVEEGGGGRGEEGFIESRADKFILSPVERLGKC